MSASTPDRSFTRTAFVVWSGLLIWAADFLLVYVFAAVACARGFADVQVSGVGIVLFAQFVSFLAAALAALGMIGIVWTALPPVLLAADCAAATSSPRP